MSNEKDDKVKAAKDVVRDVIDVAISDTLEKFKGESLNLFSESARITLTSAIAAEVFSSLSPLIEDIVSENESLWFMLDEMKVSDDLRAFEYISLAMLLTLAENDIRSLDDLAGLDNEELLEFLGPHGLSDDGEAGDIIMAARAHWFADEDAVGAEEAKEAPDSGDQPAVSDA